MIIKVTIGFELVGSS